MSRLTLSRLTQLTANPSAAVDTINQNLEDIENAVEDTVSRSGQVPTYMTHELDMNSQRIINLGEPVDDNDAVRKIDVTEAKSAAEEAASRAEASAATAALRAQESEESAANSATSATRATDAADRAEAVLSDPAFIEVSTDLLKGDESEIKKVNANKENIDTVADNTEYVIATGDNIDKIIAVEAGLDNIDTVATNIANVIKVGQDINNVNAVANDLDNIDTVEANLTNIDTVSDNIQNVSTVADNIQDIKDAPEYAALSKQYAVGEPSEPTEHSSKWWAQHAGLVPKGAYNASTTYGKNDLVYVDGESIRTFYSSLQDSNTGHAVTEASWWLEMWSVSSGGSVAFENITGEVSDNPKLVVAFNAKQPSLNTTQLAAVNSGINTTKVTNYDTHIADTVIHVTAADKTNWNDKQNATDNTLTTTDKTIVGAINELVTGEKHFLNKQMISNCITEIPQDIELELNNGILTLKAGSKVYVPNGFENDGTTKKFVVVTISSDITNTTTGSGEKMFLNVYNNGTNLFAGFTTGRTVTERPVYPILYALYYNTTTNKIEFYNGANWISDCSFPIALYTRGSISTTSIDQVFNGFGYIGSTVFALPGVKGLIPNGRNADGSLKSIEFTTSNVISETATSGNDNIYVAINSDASALSRLTYITFVYDEENNINYYNGSKFTATPICWHSRASGVVYNFNPKKPFHALDYNDKHTIIGWGFPSDRYIDLTVGASGATYTAPANGYIYASANTGAGTSWMAVGQNGWNDQRVYNQQYQNVYMFAPVQKGAFIFTYGGNISFNAWRFYYAEGEK